MITRLRSAFHHLKLNRPRAMSGHVHNTNAACCSIPPVVTDDYTHKGEYKAYGGYSKVYVTGPATSTNAILCVYDIFGFFPQTRQGADIIASTLNTTVYMPDFFEPEPAYPIEKFPPTTDELKQDLQNFFGSTASPPKTVTKILEFGKVLKGNGYKNVGLYGYCWGGKVALLSAGEGTPFDAVSMIHPGMMSVDDATNCTIPLAMYISKDEPVDEYNKMVEVMSKKPFADKCDQKNYTNMFHGWAAARGDLKNEENKKEYEDVYNRLVNFFHKAL